ncbi:ABC-F family ATP-binding cassette domain-containing protein [Anaerocolumna chitinilytica]|uniref:ABC-F family ATP-binding cassette domain-containing protein n=1 Tax=Anaerocolumna chitinilytica TaxID=1727145 RepID=UPI0016260FBE|nr:ABC-F family ATP-binding cassette domain-containing protein [Anaerocolumna chitinilytica]
MPKIKNTISKIIGKKTHILLLDEPTNHLDINDLEWLENFLINYDGTILVISHESYFLDKVTTRTLEMGY